MNESKFESFSNRVIPRIIEHRENDNSVCSVACVNFLNIFNINISAMLKYENADIIQRYINSASALWINSPNSTSLTNIYTDNNSSLCVINGNTNKSAPTTINKNSVDKMINVIPIDFKSFLFFNNGDVKNR